MPTPIEIFLDKFILVQCGQFLYFPQTILYLLFPNTDLTLVISTLNSTRHQKVFNFFWCVHKDPFLGVLFYGFFEKVRLSLPTNYVYNQPLKRLFTYLDRFHGKLISLLAVHWYCQSYCSKISITEEKANLSFRIPAERYDTFA